MAKLSTKPATDEQAALTVLQQRYKLLHERQISTKANLQTAMDRLDQLKKDAKEKYGTDDIQQLQELHTTWTQQNKAKLSEYQTLLDDIDRGLNEVESKFKEPGVSE